MSALFMPCRNFPWGSCRVRSEPLILTEILMPSGIIGPYDTGKNHLVQMTADYIQRKLPACVRGGYDFTDVRNVADGCIKAMDSAQRWETYILSGHYMKIYDFLCTAGQNADRKPVPALPKAAAELGLPFVTAYCHLRHIRPLYTGCSLHTISSNAMFSHMKAERDLGCHFRDIHESIRDMTAYIMDQMDTVS